MKNKQQRQEFDFALVIDGVPELTSDVENALFDAGCDDATFSIQYGRLYAAFTRVAGSLEAAILSAIRDVRKARVGADIVRVDESDLVTPSEIARRIGRSRQLVFQYINGQRGPGNFPPPAYHLTDQHPWWTWCAVSQWLVQHQIIRPEVARQAEVLATVNAALESAHHRKRSPGLLAAVTDLVSNAP